MTRRKEYNEIIVRGAEAKMICYQKGNRIEVLIDTEDVPRIAMCGSWHVTGSGYIGNRKYKRLHRFIMDAPEDMFVDHINGNTYDNRKCNLRIVTHQQNMMNTKLRYNNSGAKGVYHDKKYNNYKAKIKFNKKLIHLGTFDTLEEAIKARKEAEAKYFGEYARKE